MAEPKKFESALPALLMQLAGTKETVRGGTTSASSTSSANLDPLMQIFGQQMNSSTPAGMEALLGELFSQGARKVPELTQAYANAVGGRSSNNSGLALALAELNKGLTGQAATLVGEQQAKASNTAANIAQATRSTQTNTTTPTTVRSTGNPKAAGALGTAGFALNAADKLGLLKALKGGVGDMFSTAPQVAATAAPSMLEAPQQLLNPLISAPTSYGFLDGAGASSAGDSFASFAIPGSSDFVGPLLEGAQPALDFGSGADSFSLAGAGSDLLSGFNPADYDLSGFTDWSNGFANSGGVLDANALTAGYDAYDFQSVPDVADAGSWLGDAGSWLEDTASSVGSWLSSLWADGGLVSKENLFERRKAALDAAEAAAVAGSDTNAAFQARLREQVQKKQQASSQKAPGYADGGSVIRNRINMGGPIRERGSSAVNYMPAMRKSAAGFSELADGLVATGGASPSMSAGNSLNSAQLMDKPAMYMKYKQALAEEADRKFREGLGAGDSSTNTNTTVGTPSENSAAVAGMGLSALGTLGPIGALASAAISGLTGAPSITSIAISSLAQALGISAPPGVASGAVSDANAGIANAVASQTGMDPLDALMSVTDGFGTGGDAPGEGPGAGPGASAGDATSGDGGTGTSSDGSGSDGGTATAADGGHIKGKGTGISDSIPARLSDGEFVFSADVVKLLGADFLQSIQDQFHTPAAVQRMAGAR